MGLARADGQKKHHLPIEVVVISVSFEDLLRKAYKLEKDIDIRSVFCSGCEIGSMSLRQTPIWRYGLMGTVFVHFRWWYQKLVNVHLFRV